MNKREHDDKKDLTRHEERHAFESARKKINAIVEKHLDPSDMNLDRFDELKTFLESDLLAELYGEMLMKDAMKQVRERMDQGKTD